MVSMQGIINEGSDHIKDLEQKIKAQGIGQKPYVILEVYILSCMCVKEYNMGHIIW